ncbi:MAG: hypothetical protein AAGC67_01700, partial [Myxococcota bacterium]
EGTDEAPVDVLTHADPTETTDADATSAFAQSETVDAAPPPAAIDATTPPAAIDAPGPETSARDADEALGGTAR